MKTGKLFAIYVKAVLDHFHLPASPAVVRLLVMIAAHESGGFRYVTQIGNGPAKGLLQMEPVGLEEAMRYYRLRSGRFTNLPDLSELHLNQLVFDACLALVCGRVFFMAKPEALPEEQDIEGLARYAKKHWNTDEGKATWEDYFNAYCEHCV